MLCIHILYKYNVKDMASNEDILIIIDQSLTITSESQFATS